MLLVKMHFYGLYDSTDRLELHCFRSHTNPGKTGFGLVNFRIASDRMSVKPVIKDFYLRFEKRLFCAQYENIG